MGKSRQLSIMQTVNCGQMCLSHWYVIGYLSQWYLIHLFVVDLALILRHRQDCSIKCTVKSVMVNLGQQILKVLSLRNTNRG